MVHDRDAFSCRKLRRSKRSAPARCRGEESTSHLSPRLRLMASTLHLHVDCLINSGPFGYRFEVDVEKAGQQCSDRGI
jgi:hypothetical protein